MTASVRDLLLFPLGNATVGVWEEDISSVAAARSLHRLPLSPPAVAGMTIIEERGATIFDLGACLGMSDRKPRETTRFLLIKDQERISGFSVAGAIETCRCPENEVLAMPEAVRTPVIGTCMVRNGAVIPIIQIRKLHDRLQQGILDVLTPDPPKTDIIVPESPHAALRLFSLGGETFCVRGEGSSYASSAAIPITELPYARERAEGVLFHDGAVVPVVTVADRIGIVEQSSIGILFMNSPLGPFAMPVGGDRGSLDGKQVATLPLPPLARTPWMGDALVREEGVVPAIDLSAVIAPPEARAGHTEEEGIYAPNSAFPLRFEQDSVDVVEFSLLGALHAVPKEEVKEITAPQPFRSIPGSSEIVIGVAEQEGRLLPVIDLAAIFGRRTPPGKANRMLRIANGDFNALMLVEQVGHERVLPPELQRKVPIALPHQVLYGCYLDDRAVRLIMNVYSLAVHFERTEVRDLVASLAPPAETAPVDEVPQAAKPVTPAPEQHGIPVVPRSAGYSGTIRDDRAFAATVTTTRDEEQQELRRRQAAEAEAREEARRQQEAAARAGEAAKVREAEAARQRVEAEARAQAEAAERAEKERRAAEAAKERAAAVAGARADAEAEERAAAEQRAAAEAQAKQIAAEGDRAEAARKAAVEEEQRERMARAAAMEKRRAEAELEQQRAVERFRQVVDEEVETASSGGLSTPETSRAAAGEAPFRSRRTLTIAALIAAMLVLLLYWAGGPSSPDRPEPVSLPERQEAAPVQEPEAPLVLDVPSSMPKPDLVVYVVVKGDTLWDIAERFTGDPFNYPRVAKDNSIATPDLIFPGQRIQLRQQP